MQASASSNKLTYAHKEAIGLLSIGTFLEYFDLMLYVHMAVLLNELFFPKTDPFTASLIAAFSFWSTYLLRPFGALVFGWIGDNIGRKATVVITTAMMSLSCLLMANLPTYAQIGITASWAVTICRMIQGFSSMGEIIGAELYLSELIPVPARYVAVSIISVCSAVGMTAALGTAYLVNTIGLNWRAAFWVGVVIALVGFFARTKLRETKDFVDAKKRLKSVLVDPSVLKTDPIVLEKANKKTTILYFFIQCAWPVWFYLAYIYSGGILKNQFSYAAASVIKHNFYLASCNLIHWIVLAYLVSKMHPLKILKVKTYVFMLFILFLPFMLGGASTPQHLFCIQLGILLCAPGAYPALGVFFVHFPIFKRFTYISFIYALSRAVMYGVVSFGIAILSNYLSHWGLLLIMIPVIIGYTFGIYHFIDLEKKAGRYDF